MTNIDKLFIDYNEDNAEEFISPSYNSAEIYCGTDGSCNDSIGGFAFVAYDNGNMIESRSGFELKTTNNRMEMMAMITCLEWIKNDLKTNKKITVFLDSAYVFNGLDGNWELTKNLDLWNILKPLFQALRSTVKLKLLKGHNEFPINEVADYLSRTIRIKGEEYNESININASGGTKSIFSTGD